MAPWHRVGVRLRLGARGLGIGLGKGSRVRVSRGHTLARDQAERDGVSGHAAGDAADRGEALVRVRV